MLKEKVSWFFTQIRDTNLYHEFETHDVVGTLHDFLLREHVSVGILGRECSRPSYESEAAPQRSPSA